MLIAFKEDISFQRIFPELGEKRTCDRILLETKDKRAIRAIQRAVKAATNRQQAPSVGFSEAERLAISAQYWEGREEERASFDALRGSVEERKNALRKANKKLQRIQVNVLTAEAQGGDKGTSVYTQVDLDAAQGAVDQMYEALRSDQARMDQMLQKKKEASIELLGMQTKKTPNAKLGLVAKPAPELYTGFIPEARNATAASILSPVA